MNSVYNLLTGDIGYALGWTVVHSLWQGMLIALLLAGVLIGLQKRPAQLRYLLANLSLLALLLLSAFTFNHYYQSEGDTAGLEGLVVEEGVFSKWQSKLQHWPGSLRNLSPILKNTCH